MTRARIGAIAWAATAVAAIAFAVTPILWMILTSVKSNREITQETSLVPQALTATNYISLFDGRDFASYLTNSVIVTAASVAIALILGTQAAYVLARFRLRGGLHRYIGFSLLMVRLMPPIVIIIPLFLAVQQLGLLNTQLSLIVIYAAFNVTIVVWMMESFFREIPVDLEEAAMVDGDTRFTAFRRIVLPLAAPGLVATGIFAVITTYNEFLFALVLTSTPAAETMPVGAADPDRPDQRGLGGDERGRRHRGAAHRRVLAVRPEAPRARPDDGCREVSSAPRLSDVARAAGVSLATASRALTGRGSVADATRDRVRETAARLEFRPSAAGQSLRTRSTRMIGFIVPDIGSGFYANALKGAQHRLQAAGYQTILMDTDEQPERERAALLALAAGRVDGFIVCSSGGDGSTIRTIERRFRLPVVGFDNVVEGVGSGRVTLANEAGIQLLIGHLAGTHGHRRIGYVGGIESETSGAERLAGYEVGMLRSGLRIDPAWVRPGDWTEAAGRRETAALVEADEPVSAIVYPAFDLALGGLRALRDRGLSVPGDVAVVCFDDSDAAPLLDPPLTVLARRDREIGDLAASMVLRALEHTDAGPMDVRIAMELAIRQSCGCAPPPPAGRIATGATPAIGGTRVR